MKQSAKTARKSAGILLYRLSNGLVEVMLVHPGGPYWKNKDAGSWSVPKGEFTNEAPFEAACREFKEETGYDVPPGKPLTLAPVKQNSGKTVVAFAIEANLDVSTVTSNTFKMEWPPKSGKWIDIPEVDKAAWFSLDEARVKILAGQAPMLDELITLLK